MKLNDYMPQYISNIRELKQLFSAEDDELEILRLQIDNILKEVIVKTAESYGLQRYEKIYNIKKVSTNIETRRISILSKMNNNTNFTYKWLINKLNDIIGQDNYEIKTDFNNYQMSIHFRLEYTESAEILKQDFIKQIPSNILIDIRFFSTAEYHMGATIRQASYQKIDTCMDTITETTNIDSKINTGISMVQQEYLKIDTDKTIRKENQVVGMNYKAGGVISNLDYVGLKTENHIEQKEQKINMNNEAGGVITNQDYLKIKEVEK